ncbi:hypothetical protein KAR52_01100 [Candidatus Pacearchaeota archaeon]|nr:hypothetical protein [Candidatus Pacearchaeota archaeon]
MKNKKDLDKWFLLTWKKFVISILIFILVFFFRHITIRPIFEPLGMFNIVFYLISIGIPAYLLCSLFYTAVIRKIKLKKTKKTNFFLLTWKKTGITLMIWVGAVVIHNLVYAFFLGVFNIEFEEPVFFTLAVLIIPIYFIVCLIYSLIKLVKKK